MWIEVLDFPCCRCPYRLGIVRTFINPCPKCKMDEYSLFEFLLDTLGRILGEDD